MRTYPRLGLVLTVMTLAGCAVGPDYSAPGSSLPSHFLAQTPQEQTASATAELPVWWEGFRDPLLTHYVTTALNQNLDLAQSLARIAQAKSRVSLADAALMPAANISGQAGRAYQSVETPLGQLLKQTPNFNRYGNTYEADLGASWEVDLFGGLRRNQEAARALYQATRADAIATRLAVAAQTATIYITIRGLQTRLIINRQQVETLHKRLSIARLQYDNGVTAELQVHQVEAALSQAQAVIPTLEASLAEAMNALDVILGTPPGTHRAELATDSGASIPVAPKILGTGSPADLIRRRPDLIAAERRLAAANARIGVAIAEYYPKLSLGALVGSATSISGSNLFSSGASQAAGVLGLRWRLFDFGRVNAQIADARGQEAEALAAYRLSMLKATEDVENALTTLVKREDQTNILIEGESSLARARKSSLVAYKAGAVSLIEVLQADTDLLHVSEEKVLAQTSAAKAAVSTFLALGGGWEPTTLAQN